MYRDNQVTLPLTFLDRPSSHRLDLGLRIIKGKSLVFRLCTKVTGGYGSETAGSVKGT